MSVISTLITKHCIVLASDSFITELQGDGTFDVKEGQQTKLVAVRHWRGAMAYWGLATHTSYHWSTLRWLQLWAERACNFPSAEVFARSLASELNVEISRMSFPNQRQSGIGIHFAAYERVEGYWIPELFLISNWADTSYQCVRADGVGMSRETHRIFPEQSRGPEHGQPQCRIAVHQYLQRGGWLIYNNGDPEMFNPIARALFQLFEVLSNRGLLANQDAVETYLDIARRPIEIVARAQSDFCGRGFRIVGGKPHDLGITPNGLYSSTTGDN